MNSSTIFSQPEDRESVENTTRPNTHTHKQVFLVKKNINRQGNNLRLIIRNKGKSQNAKAKNSATLTFAVQGRNSTGKEYFFFNLTYK